MADPSRLQQWRKLRERSRRRLRPEAIAGALATAVIIGLNRLAPGSTFDLSAPDLWLSLGGLFCVWWPFVDDWLNARYLARRIAQAENEATDT